MTRVVVAMSGGVDSSVAAWLLKEEGHEVIGLFLRNGVHVSTAAAKSGGEAGGRRQGCCSVEDSRDARAVAHQLGVPFYAVDFSNEFRAIVAGFVDAYRSGRTPNPCAVCNRDLKLGALRDFARSIGAESVATGHYARIVEVAGRARLARGRDRAKDQSYVLATVAPDALASARFPLGERTKPEVRELARRAGLPVAEKAESQEICFVPTGDYRDLLREEGVESREGPIVDARGAVLGRHTGVERFTIGQRRGIGVAAEHPLYVTSLDPATSTVTVGGREELGLDWLESDNALWLGVDAPAAGARARASVQVRAHHAAAPAAFAGRGAGVRVELETPEAGIAPGQLAVLYDGDLVLGSAWIDRTGKRSAA